MTRRKEKLASPPLPPRKPQPDECCNQGCTPCVFDRYEEELEKYRAALAAWRQSKKLGRR